MSLCGRPLKKLFEAAGYRVVRTPKVLLRVPEAELRLRFEDVVARRLLRRPDFFFVQIGAYDGVSNDPLHGFVKRYGWRGLLVEPQREAFQRLQENYGAQPGLCFVNAAVADCNGVREFYTVRDDRPGLPAWAGQLASFQRETILKHRDAIPDIEDLIDVAPVSCLTVDTLLRGHGVTQIDLLQIDTEGYDYEIIKLFDFGRIKPAIIHYEHRHLPEDVHEECLAYLVGHGYRVALEPGGDTTACLAET